MKKVKLKFLLEVTRTIVALLLGAGAGFTTLAGNEIAIPNKGLLMLALVVLMAVLGLALVLVFLFIHNKIK